MTKKIELLAPAGSLESLYAAVLNGADAIYLGGTKFSARAYASNFDNDTMKEALDYCHIYGVKVYITINTLVKDEEILELLQYVEYLYKIGVDALIVQDLGVANLIRLFFKNMEIHASTQMTVHNAEGALFLKELGFERIVLSRELSLEEIEKISNQYNIETEIFVHGALCICYSGQCLMSSLLGGRSGNRGRCAQPCRLPYTLINAGTNQEKEGYLLSPKDMCTIEDIDDIVKTGTSSLKIEGRMKRPEYVGGVVSSYRNAIDVLENKNSNFEYTEHKKKLLKLFNREGFSKAYLYGNIGKDMMAYNNPKNAGVFLGTVGKDNTVLLEESVSLGDGISAGESGFTVSKILQGNTEITEGKAGDRVRLYPVKYNYKDNLYKTSDYNLLSNISESYKNIYSKKNTLHIDVEFKIGAPFSLCTSHKGIDYKVDGEIVQEARNKPLDKIRLEESIRKTGDTPFAIGDINFNIFEDGFIPVSAINALRRKLIEDILDNEQNKFRRKIEGKIDLQRDFAAYMENSSTEIPKDLPSLIVCVSTEEQLRAAEEIGCRHVAIEVLKRNINFKLEEITVPNLYLKIPNIIRNEFDSICNFINKNIKKISGIITSNYGIINKFKGITTIIGDYKLNVFNSATAKLLSGHIDIVPLSLELNKKEISSITSKVKAPLQMLIYGKAELMVSEYCATGSVYGGKNSQNACSEPCKGESFYLKDRKGENFVVRNDVFCRSYIYNSVPINLISQKKEIDKIGVFSYRMDFVDENYEETLEIIKNFLGEKPSAEGGKYTRGHFKRGVE